MIKGDGTGSSSIFGKRFDDENLSIRHSVPGTLSMANGGPNSNGSQFFIALNAAPQLDGKHVVFGRVIEGIDVVLLLSSVGSRSGKPKENVRIMNCGELST